MKYFSFYRYMLCMLSLVSSHASAETNTTLTLGPVHFDGKNDYGEPDPALGFANNDWSGAKDGRGFAASIRHDRGRWFLQASAESLTIRHRGDSLFIVCFNQAGIPQPPFPSCERWPSTFDYDDDYRGLEVAVGGRVPISDAWSTWARIGYSYQRWSSSGATVQLFPPTGVISTLDPVRQSESTWNAAAGVTHRTQRLEVEVGVRYQPEGYFPSYGTQVRRGVPIPYVPVGSTSLLEGIARADWYFTPRWFGRLEYRPSRQRQYLHAGIGMAF